MSNTQRTQTPFQPARTAAVAVALLGLAAFPACKKEGGEGGGGGASSAAVSSSLSYLPKTATMVFGVNMQSLVNAKVLGKYRDELLKKAPPEMTELQTACGMDFMKDISSVVGGMVGEKQGIIVVNGNFNQAKVEECVTKAAEKEGKKIEMSDDGKIRVYKGAGDNDTMYAHFPKDGTVIINPSDLGGPALLKGVLAGEKLGDGDVMNLIKSTKTSATIWAAGDPKALSGGVPGGDDMTGFAGTLNAGDNLDVKVLINFSSEEKAKATHAQAEGGLSMAKGHPMAAPFKEIIEKFKLEADGKAMKAGISMTAGDLEKIANAAKQFGML